MSVRVFAPAKINLTLQVARPRADGLHPLQSVVVFADVGDIVEAEAAETLSLKIHGDFADDLVADEGNLVLRAAHALAREAGVAPQAALSLEKNLPIASGIGGGSADAAATLSALNKLWKLDLPLARLIEVARPIGADVPVCFAGGAAYMEGAGEAWAAMSAPALAAILVNPLKALPTPSVYHAFDALNLGGAFTPTPAPSWRDLAEAVAAIASIGNDLTAPARSLMPEISAIEAELRADSRTRHAGLSGSGATMFALVDDMSIAEAMADELQARHPAWWVTEARLNA